MTTPTLAAVPHRIASLALFAFFCLVGACGGTSAELLDASVALCGGGCGSSCAAGERCLGGASDGASLYGFASRCASTCASDTDCVAGTVCLSLAGESTRAAVCLPAQAPPAACGHVDCPGAQLASCLDATTLLRPIDGWCGSERVHCANGCVAESADGGSGSAVCAP